MKCGARVALGVAGGYLLGRTKKMKLALMLGGMVAGRRAGGPGELLKSGTKLLGSSPELARLGDEVRGRLLEAGKSAAVAVATRQVESITNRVGRRVESLGEVGLPKQRKSAEPADAEAPAGDERAEDERPADERPSDEGPSDEGPSDEGRADEGPADEGPVDEGPVDETPADDAPAEEEGPSSEGPSSEGRSSAGRSSSARSSARSAA